MEVRIAEVSGFCYGVERAYNLAQDAFRDEKKNISFFGELIHNDRVMKDFVKRGGNIIDDPSTKDTGTLIVRAHGISDSKKNELTKNAKNLIDATCPYVTKIHIMARRYEAEGRLVIIVGDPNHPEIKGTVEDLKNYICVRNAEEAQKLNDNLGAIGVVCQATLREDIFMATCEVLKKKSSDFVYCDTICTATTDRQNAIRKLAQEVDIVIVIGGKKSSNTKKLAEIAREYTEVMLIQGLEDIDTEKLVGKKIAGISAGASTPEDQVQELVRFLEDFPCENTK